MSSYQYSRLPPTFQSTLPVWGATTFAQRLPLPHFDFNPRSPCGERRAGPSNPVYPTGDFNPRSPCGERPGRRRSSILTEAISIHAPRVGSDLRTFNPRSPCGERLEDYISGVKRAIFQSTLPVWGATIRSRNISPAAFLISIHAPRVGSDSKHAQIHLCDSFIIRQNYRKRQLISARNTCFKHIHS